MKNPELFHKTISILVNAYINDTLEIGNDCACAVGNLICSNMGLSFKKDRDDLRWSKSHPVWYTIKVCGFEFIDPSDVEEFQSRFTQQIDSTGYSWEEILKIEAAFEGRDGNYPRPTDIFSALMAVCDALMIIHEASKEEAQEAKLLFVK